MKSVWPHNLVVEPSGEVRTKDGRALTDYVRETMRPPQPIDVCIVDRRLLEKMSSELDYYRMLIFCA